MEKVNFEVVELRERLRICEERNREKDDQIKTLKEMAGLFDYFSEETQERQLDFSMLANEWGLGGLQ